MRCDLVASPLICISLGAWCICPQAAAADSLATVIALPIDVQQRPSKAASDPTLPEWQRRCMEALSESMKSGGGSVEPPSLTSPPTDGGWSPLLNPGRVAMTMVLDTARNRIVVFGGRIDASDPIPPNDTWVLDLNGTPNWRMLRILGPRPAARLAHAAIYDPIRDRMIVNFGYGVDGYGDTWALTFSPTPTWAQIETNGVGPPARNGHKAIYDPVRDRMVMFGGLGGQTFYNDTWALTLSEPQTWTQLLPSGIPPAPRREHTVIYDPPRDRLIVFGGGDVPWNCFNDVWALEFSGEVSWSQLLPTGEAPWTRRGHVAICDEPRNRMLIHAGYDGSAFGDTWAMSLDGEPAWTLLSDSGPARFWPAAAYNPSDSSMVMTGGAEGPMLHNDLWVLTLQGPPAWKEILPSTVIPPSRGAHTTIYDSIADELVIFGGWRVYFQDVDRYNDVWTLSLSDPPSWTRVEPEGVQPSPRNSHSAVYDPIRNQMLVFGGDDGSYRNDTWTLSLGANPDWDQLSPTGTLPPPRVAHTAIYDPPRDRMIVFGGTNGTRLNDTWALTLEGTPNWSELIPSGTPPPGRYWHSAVYDPEEDRVIVYGGESTGTRFGDAWSLDLEDGSWIQLAPTGPAPSPRFGHSAVYDPALGRMVIFGGFDGTARDDCFALALRGELKWRQLLPRFMPSPRVWHNAIVDSDPSRMVVFGGSAYGNDAWSLAWTTLTVLEEEPRDISQQSQPLYPTRSEWNAIHPSTRGDHAIGEAVIRFAIPSRSRVDLDVIDVSGRKVRTLLGAILPSGEHETTWDGRDDNGATTSAGVYLVRLMTEQGLASRKIIRF